MFGAQLKKAKVDVQSLMADIWKWKKKPQKRATKILGSHNFKKKIQRK
jgi:hypothetical protein